MSQRQTLPFTMSLLLLAAGANAQTPVVTEPAAQPSPHPWSLETELIQPFVPTVGILRLRAGRTLWGTPGGLRGDLMVGVFIRPNVEHTIVERINEYLLAVGYRQYFWRGLHVEVELNGGWAWGTNRIDAQLYSNPSVLLNLNAGYRFGFFEPGGFFDNGGPVGFFVTPQVGVIQGLWTNIGPRGGRSDTFLQAGLLVGVSF
jgi:hypothetical protein